MYQIKIRDEIVGLLFTRAKRENKRIEELTNELLSQALWDEPGILFKGKYCKIEPDLFGNNEPKEQ